MTYKQITQQITLLKQQIALIEQKVEIDLKREAQKPAKNSLLEATGIWKSHPRTKKDIEKIRRILWGAS